MIPSLISMVFIPYTPREFTVKNRNWKVGTTSASNVTAGVIEKIWKQVNRAFILAKVALEAMQESCRASIYLYKVVRLK